jgi:hypothetical protein
MPPKKDDKKKSAAPTTAVVTISEDELLEAQTLPELNDFVFTNLYAFKMTRNQSRLTDAFRKQFQFVDPEAENYSEEAAAKYKTIEMAQLLAQA